MEFPSLHRETAMKTRFLPAAVLLSFLTLSVQAAELKVEVLGIGKAEGHVLLALYDEGQFLKKPLKRLRLPAAGSAVRGSFGDVPDGSYAVIAFHDLNGNGRL